MVSAASSCALVVAWSAVVLGCAAPSKPAPAAEGSGDETPAKATAAPLSTPAEPPSSARAPVEDAGPEDAGPDAAAAAAADEADRSQPWAPRPLPECRGSVYGVDEARDVVGVYLGFCRAERQPDEAAAAPPFELCAAIAWTVDKRRGVLDEVATAEDRPARPPERRCCYAACLLD
jgi:hypothetical protein